MTQSVLRSVRDVLTGPTAMFITATTTATVCATLISLSFVAGGAQAGPQAPAEAPTTCPEPSEAVAEQTEFPQEAPAVEVLRVPRVRQAKATVDGERSRDEIRQIVRSHINEVRYCYNEGLTRDPELEGRVSIQFTIAPDGTVPEAVVAHRTLPDAAVAECIANAVPQWVFPWSEDDAMAVVTYPFVLSPG